MSSKEKKASASMVGAWFHVIGCSLPQMMVVAHEDLGLTAEQLEVLTLKTYLQLGGATAGIIKQLVGQDVPLVVPEYMIELSRKYAHLGIEEITNPYRFLSVP